MFRILFPAFILLLAMSGRSQDTINVTDSQGRRQGFWRKTDTAGHTVYEGRFVNGQPAGEFRYFYPNGKIKTISVVSDNGRKAVTQSFFANGRKMASGNYINEKKDSTWQFFGENTGVLASEETYVAGKVEGKSRTFYPDGVVAEMVYYKNGIRDGLWEQYFTDGKLKLRGAFKAGEKHGPFITYHVNAKPMITGQYQKGLPEGVWIYFDEKGVVLKKEYFQNGILVKTDEPGKK